MCIIPFQDESALTITVSFLLSGVFVTLSFRRSTEPMKTKLLLNQLKFVIQYIFSLFCFFT